MRSGTSSGTRADRIRPLIKAMAVVLVSVLLDIRGRVVSIVVAPPGAILVR